jgi:uroporphyrinogen-III synthase
MCKKDSNASFSLLTTRGLSNEASNFISEMNWSLDTVKIIETKGAVSRPQILKILEEFNKKPKQLLLIFSSENAIKHLVAGFNHFGFDFPSGLSTVCVGNKTKEAAETLVQARMVCSGDNSTLLLKRLLKDFSPECTFVYFCGNRRLPILPDGLKENGFTIKEFFVYTTVLTPVKLLNYYDAVLFFSPSAVDSYFEKNKWHDNMIAVSIGNLTSERLALFGVENICESETPGEIPMLEKLNEHLFVHHK